MKINTGLVMGLGAFLGSAGLTLGLLSDGHNGPAHYQPYQPTDPAKVVEPVEEEGESASGAARYLKMLKANPSTGTYSVADVKRAQEQAAQANAKAKSSAFDISWRSLGPDNVGGRTRAIIVSNQDRNVLFAGGASGGLYKSTNKGATWNRVPYEGAGRFKSLAISCMEQASDGTIYFGTGERGFTTIWGLQGANARSGFKGMGMWKSTDGGQTWEHLESTIPDQPFGSGRSIWSSINEIAIDPNNPDRIFAATMNGLMVSEDAGESWQRITNGLFPNIYLEVEFSNDGNILFAAAKRSLYRSTDGGNSFSRIERNSGFPQNNIGRIELAFAPTDQDFVYANVTTAAEERLKGIYRSQDGGESWNPIVESGTQNLFDPFANPAQGQGTWDNTIAVSPVDKYRIFVGGVTFWTYQGDGNGQGQWQKIANGTKFIGNFKNPDYLHVDNHEIRFDTKANPPIMYIGNDGGIFRTSTDFTKQLDPEFKELNTGYTTAQFYAFDAVPNGDVLGGTQDNGTFKYLKDGLTKQSYRGVLGGDGFYSVISELQPSVYISESQYANLGRSSDEGGSYNRGLYDDNIGLPEPNRLSTARDRVLFNTPFELYENANDTLRKDSVTFGVSTDVKLAKGETTEASVDLVQKYANDTLDLERVQGRQFRALNDLARLPGDSITITSENGVDFTVAADSALRPEEEIKVQDPVRALFALALRDEIWVTPDMLNFSTNPTWYKVADINLNTPASIKFSKDGKALLVGGATQSGDGRLYRIEGIREAQYTYRNIPNVNAFKDSNNIETTNIGSFNGVVTSATYEMGNKNRMLVTTGNYGVTNHVFFSSDAMSGNPNYSPLDNQGTSNLPEMPVYDGMFKLDSASQVIVGTEMGVWAYDLATPSAGWQAINKGMTKVPVFMLRQFKDGYKYEAFAGTYGRGIFKTGQSITSVPDEVRNSTSNYQASIKVYPNPAGNFANVKFTLPEGSDARLQMVNMSGQVVKQDLLQGDGSEQTVRYKVNSLERGTYVVNLQGEQINKTAKVVVR